MRRVIGGVPVAMLAAVTSACAPKGGSSAPAPAAAFSAVDVRVGTGPEARNGRCVFTHYTGALPDGAIFEASRDSTGAGTPVVPVSFPLGVGRVIAGWDRGFTGMRAGGTRRLVVPAALAYGATGRPPMIPPNTTLHFEVELLLVTDTLPHDRRAARGDYPTPACPPWSRVRPLR
jgi:hypothetical protein